ncbi:hypothetical protein KC19_3G073500 [Ceratodon purpureus]|uniref:Uncharacterized protein n=1 Tax=Ceratodon purpureus TaxID=3225 RepID=A0A8T0IJI8_CERPU|nr:hypothetical protein KC19_3G073500 [Ceratodon purpureus]
MAATHATNKRPCASTNPLPELTASKRWKSMEPPPATQPGGGQEFDLRVKILQQAEPTSVLDLQTSPGRSSSTSSTSLSSGDDSPHSAISNNSRAANFETSLQVEEQHVDIANWMDCMALPEFEECGRHLEEVLTSDIGDLDFDFELTSLDSANVVEVDHSSVSCFPCFPSLLSEFLGDVDEEPLLLPESFHDAQRLQELDESLSSMLSCEVTRSDTGVPTTAELVKLVESQSCEEPGRTSKNGKQGTHNQVHASHHSRSESWGSTSEVTPAPEPEECGLQLVHLLLACAEAIEKSDFATAKPILTQLRHVSNPYGDPMQRIALYFGEALSDRLANVAPSLPPHSPSDSKLAYQAFYKVLPFAKFSHVTANQTIYEAVVHSSHVHVVDLDIQQGLQWPCFIQSLAMRPGGSPHLRISAVGTNAVALQTTKRRLSEFAEALSVPFEFTPVLSTLENLSPAALNLRPKEDLAINCSQVLHTLAGDDSSLLSNLLAMFRSLNPNVVTLLEVEANHNQPSFLTRFVEALHHYCALFDSLEGALSRDSNDRFHIESTAFAAEIKDIVALKGNNRRSRHLKSETWRGLFLKAGFQASAFSSYTIQQAQMLLEFLTKPVQANSPMPYKLSEESTALILGWQDTPVMGVSAWSC